ncbi:hypothetical protein AB0N38_33190 [Micromonospora aurantiaca]|uniref:hypothetical protein n=1 Tax=Micromonospora aurantiaca (nom. illeg.) TaxID=47850 RepID=UPI00342BFFFE
MAEIVRTETRVHRQKTGLGEVTEPVSNTGVRVVVRSIRCDEIDASVVRDFTRALDAAAAPGNARITGDRSQVGRLVELKAEWTESLDPPDPPSP